MAPFRPVTRRQWIDRDERDSRAPETDERDSDAPDTPAADAPRPPDEAARRADELAAVEARRRHRSGIREEVEPDGAVGCLLADGERLLAVRRRALLDRRQSPRPGPPGLAGDVYLTSTRILHVNGSVLAYELDDIVETGVAGHRLLLLLTGGRSVALVVDRPRLLRVDIAAARTDRLRCTRGGAGGGDG